MARNCDRTKSYRSRVTIDQSAPVGNPHRAGVVVVKRRGVDTDSSS